MMNRTLLAATAAAAALVSTPSFARPMTATDMHMMHRMGAPSVSPDGRHAVFTLSTTDLAANKRTNPLMMLDLAAKGAVPQAIPGLTKGAHDAVFGDDGALWYLAPIAGQDQLFDTLFVYENFPMETGVDIGVPGDERGFACR